MTVLYSLIATLALALPGPASDARADVRVERAPSSLVYPDFWHTPFGIHRGTQQLLDLLLNGQARFDDPAGAACAQSSSTEGDEGPVTFFGVNRGAGQIIYNPDMQSLAVFGGKGAGDGHFFRPEGVACLPDGTLVVADTGNNRVVFLKYRLGRLRWDRALGGPGRSVGLFAGPEGVALDSQGRLYVADTGNNRVQIFDRQGVFLEAFGDDPDANNAVLAPQALAVADPLEPDSLHPEPALFVVDAGGARIQKFNLSGDFLGQASASSFDRPAVRFGGLALDYFGNVWVTDRLSGQIHKFDGHLQWISDWGGQGQGDGRLDDPRGIAINRPYGQVVVLERDSAQYLWIGADLADLHFSHLTDLVRGGAMRTDFRLSERAWIDAWIEDNTHERIATLLEHAFRNQGDQTLLWKGGLDDGTRVQPGVYFLVLQAEAAYSSATFVKRELRARFIVASPSPSATMEKPEDSPGLVAHDKLSATADQGQGR